jgi:hypothetical protein
MARELAIEVLRYAAPHSAPSWRAVAVLEGGTLRMRHAVELAGLVLDATGVTGEGIDRVSSFERATVCDRVPWVGRHRDTAPKEAMKRW